MICQLNDDNLGQTQQGKWQDCGQDVVKTYSNLNTMAGYAPFQMDVTAPSTTERFIKKVLMDTPSACGHAHTSICLQPYKQWQGMAPLQWM